MSSRPSIVHTVKIKQLLGEGHRQSVPEITAQVRLHFPRSASPAQVQEALREAYTAVSDAYAKAHADGFRSNV